MSKSENLAESSIFSYFISRLSNLIETVDISKSRYHDNFMFITIFILLIVTTVLAIKKTFSIYKHNNMSLYLSCKNTENM